MKILTFANNKGGQGKTTSALCVAHQLVELGHRVLLIDADPQGNTSQTMILDPVRGHLGNAMIDPADDNPNVHTIATLGQQPNPARSLTVVASNPSMGIQEKTFGTQLTYMSFFKRELAALEGQYEFVIIDTAPSLGPLTLSALAASHAVFVPMIPDFFGSTGMTALLKMSSRVRTNFNESLRIGGIFFVRYAASYRRSLHRQYVSALESDPTLEKMLMKQTIRDNISLAEAQGLKMPIHEYAPNSAGALDYAALTDEILTRIS